MSMIFFLKQILDGAHISFWYILFKFHDASECLHAWTGDRGLLVRRNANGGPTGIIFMLWWFSCSWVLL